MSLTAQQIQSSQQITLSLLAATEDFLSFLKEVNALEQNNWVQVITVGGVTVNAIVGASDQTTLLATYTTLKANLVTIFGQLP